MKRRTEYLVEKRDGRREWLRATKLARSIHCALLATHEAEPWRAVELAQAVLAGLDARRPMTFGRGPQPFQTSALAEAVQRVLLAGGFVRTATAYVRVGAERRRRQSLLQELRPGPQVAGVTEPPAVGRLPRTQAPRTEPAVEPGLGRIGHGRLPGA